MGLSLAQARVRRERLRIGPRSRASVSLVLVPGGKGGLAMRDTRRGLGRRGEQIAARYLAENGYLVVDENWRCSAGELDLVARQGASLVCVEVRTRRGDRLGSPEESITAAKRQRLIALAEAYVQEHSWGGAWRIDMIAVEMDGRGRLLRVDHYENAVTG